MNKSGGIVVGIIAAILVIGYILLVVFRGNIWEETYRSNDSEPYDLDLFVELLEVSAPSSQRLNEPIGDYQTEDSAKCLVFIDDFFHADSSETQDFLDFIEQGNSAFLSAHGISHHLMKRLNEETDEDYFELVSDQLVEAYLENDTTGYPFEFRNKIGPVRRYWTYMNFSGNEVYNKEVLGYFIPNDPEDYIFHQIAFPDSDGEIIYEEEYDEEGYSDDYFSEEELFEEEFLYESDSTLEDSTFHTDNEPNEDFKYENFVRFQIGKGSLIIHTDRIFFSNYYIIEEEGFSYAQKVIAHLPNQHIIWDDYHGTYRWENEDVNYNSQPQSPLRFIFEQPPLKYAWYTIILTTLLFVVFRSKRQQRIIPLVPRVENTSIAFAHSLGALLYKADSGKYLAQEMMKLFNNFNRRKYGIKRKKDNDGLAEEIAKKAKVPVHLVKTILELERKIVFNPSSRMMENAELYRKLDSYYKQARK